MAVVPKPVSDAWIDRLILAGGIIIGLLILYGFFHSLQPFLKKGAAPDGVMPTCEECLTLSDTNTSITLTAGEEKMLILPKEYFSEDGLTIISDPVNVMSHRFDTSRNSSDYWVVILQAQMSGVADVVVRSNRQTISDFHLSVNVN